MAIRSDWRMVVVAMGLTLGACGSGSSEEERQDAQDHAMDVAGRYVEDAATGVPARLTLVNESGKHDIVATLELRGGLDEVDRSSVRDALKVDDAALTQDDLDRMVGTLEAALLNLKLGEGATFALRGGENVALDKTGDISEIALRRSISGVMQSDRAAFDATLGLFMTAFKGAGDLGYQTTSFTDDEGMSAQGAKGLFMTLTRTPFDTGSGRTIMPELRLMLGSMVKY